VLDKVDTGIEFLIPAYENGGNSSKAGGVESNEIFGIGGEVVLLSAAQAKVTNLLEKWSQLSLTDDEIGGSFTAIPQRAGASPVAVKTIGC
jgi:hypothetical protein